MGQRYNQLLLTHIIDAFEQQRHAISMRLNEMPYLLRPHHYRRTRDAVAADRAVAPLVGTRQLVQLAHEHGSAVIGLNEIEGMPVETDQDSDARENAPRVSRFRYPAQS